MTPTRPYLIRAMHDWIVDNNCTPHLLVDAAVEGVRVPKQYIENGMIVLNVAPSAVRSLDLGNEYVSFNARFAGTAHDIFVPVSAIQAIYARENGQGIFLGEGGAENALSPDSRPTKDATERKGSNPPHLTIVK